MGRAPRAACIVALAWAACAVAAPALGLMIEKSVEELSTEAGIIVVGRVAAQESAWNEVGEIHTDVTLRVDRVVAGSADPEITFRVAGGQVGDIRMRTSDDPSFELGERVLVFLDSSQKPPRLVGLEQGALRVREELVERRGREQPLPDVLDEVTKARQRAR